MREIRKLGFAVREIRNVHEIVISPKIKLDKKEAKRPNFWKKSIKLSGNYNFEQPDPSQSIDLPKLWGYQDKLPQISITWQDIKAAMPLLWAEQQEQLSVDFAYNEFELFIPLYDKNIKICRKSRNQKIQNQCGHFL